MSVTRLVLILVPKIAPSLIFGILRLGKAAEDVPMALHQANTNSLCGNPYGRAKPVLEMSEKSHSSQIFMDTDKTLLRSGLNISSIEIVSRLYVDCDSVHTNRK